MNSENPPAGWYPDPEGGVGQRYWDGTQWTEHRHGAEPTAPPEPPPPPGGSFDPARPAPAAATTTTATTARGGGSAGTVITLIGGAVAIIGSLLDWVSFPGGAGGTNLNAFQKDYPWVLTGADGFDEGTIGHGWFILLGALVAMAAAGAVAAGKRGPSGGGAIAGGGLITLIAVLAIVRWQTEDVVGDGIDYGIGLFLTLAAGLVTVVGGFMLAKRS